MAIEQSIDIWDKKVQIQIRIYLFFKY